MNNPYVQKVKLYPEKIFELEDFDCECQKLHERLLAYKGVICELGSGSGEHLIERALGAPDVTHLGFEIRYKRSVRTIEKAERKGAANLLVIRNDANLLAKIFSLQSLDGVYVNFPDPWTKPKQHKKRLLNTRFVEVLAPLLKEKGFLSFKTDHAGYFEKVVTLLKVSESYEIIELTSDLYASKYLSENVQTEFERLFVSQGLPIHYVKAVAVKK